MEKQLFPDASANMFRSHPQVIQLGFLMPYFQSIETENLVILFGEEDLISDNKVWGDCEVILPVLYPVFRIAPITLSVMSDLS